MLSIDEYASMCPLPYWPKPSQLASALLCYDRPTLGLELAPSGRVHPGIVRTLLYAKAVQDCLASHDKQADILIRVNDLAAIRDGERGARALGRPLIMDATTAIGQDPLQQLLADLDCCQATFSIRISRIVRSSECYDDQAFRSLLVKSLAQAPTIEEVLRRRQRHPGPLFTPLCTACRHLYSVDLLPADAGHGWYRCRNCGAEGGYDVATSAGLVGFKLESALIWRYLDISADVHGQDHVEAYDVAAELSRVIHGAPPVAGRVNSTFNNAGEKVSKSRRNFLPVAEMDERQGDQLLALIKRTSWRQPIRLPRGLDQSDRASRRSGQRLDEVADAGQKL